MSADDLEKTLADAELPELSESMVLVRRYQAGDEEALSGLLERYQGRIRRIVRIQLGSKLRQHVESMDIAQEVNAIAVRKLAQLEVRDNGSLLRWLTKVALNKIRETDKRVHAGVRDADRNVALDSPAPGASRAVDAAAPAGPLPEEEAWRNELREILDDSMTRLPAEYREVILLRDYYAGSWEWVAAELKKPNVHAAQEFHRRAWIKLRRVVRPRLSGLM